MRGGFDALPEQRKIHVLYRRQWLGYPRCLPIEQHLRVEREWHRRLSDLGLYTIDNVLLKHGRESRFMLRRRIDGDYGHRLCGEESGLRQRRLRRRCVYQGPALLSVGHRADLHCQGRLEHALFDLFVLTIL